MGTRELGLNVYRVSIWDEEKVQEMNSHNACIIMEMYLMPVYCTHENGLNGKFCYINFTIIFQE